MPIFWHEFERQYVEVLGTFDGPRQWSLHVRGSGGREWRTAPGYLRPYNNAARALLASLLLEVEGA